LGFENPILSSGNGFASRQDTHDHVFQSALGGDGGHTQLDVLAAVFLELDLAVLGQPPLGDVQVGHDLDSETTAALYEKGIVW
jgi:hypothetical protein